MKRTLGDFANACGGTQTAKSSAATLTVNPKTVHGSFTASNKTYDGTDAASISGRSLAAADIVGNDNVVLSAGSATFASAAWT